MGRKPRIPSETGCYHIVARGNNQQAVFLADNHFLVYQRLLEKYKDRYCLSIYHYCLMSNHVHLVLRADGVDALSEFMRDLQHGYVVYRRQVEQLTGHLWEGRFRSSSIEKESYLSEAGRYVERNPVNAGMVEDPGGYRWSSYRVYAYGEPNGIVTLSPLYGGLGISLEERQRAYRCYVSVERDYEVFPLLPTI